MLGCVFHNKGHFLASWIIGHGYNAIRNTEFHEPARQEMQLLVIAIAKHCRRARKPTTDIWEVSYRAACKHSIADNVAISLLLCSLQNSAGFRQLCWDYLSTTGV